MWKFSRLVIRVHCFHILFRWGAEDFNDFDDLLWGRSAGKHGRAQEKLADNAASWPDIDGSWIVLIAKYKFRGTIITRANIAYISLSFYQLFCASEIAQPQNMRIRITQKILRLQISMAYSFRMYISKRSEYLIRINFNNSIRHNLILLIIQLKNIMSSRRDIIRHNIEIRITFSFFRISIKCFYYINTVWVL